MSQYKGFYKKSIEARLKLLNITQDKLIALSPTIYNNMIENAITTFELPMGVAPNYLINDIERVIPMVTEEPSVIAASSNGASIIKRNGGFKARVISRLMRGEIAFINPHNPDDLIAYINTHQADLREQAAKAHPSIIKRGGGLQTISTRIIKEDGHTVVIVDVSVDTKQAMGANIINTILEQLRLIIEAETHEEALMAILTNNTPDCLVEATCSIDPVSLKYPEKVGAKIAEASLLSKLDPYRTATHNKGVMNGIDAVLLATGNDTRAVNAGLYAYHVSDGKLKPFTTWEYRDGIIYGKATLPMAVGTVGGSIGLNPKVALAYEILGTHDAQTLMECIACVALAQNFAALYALTTDGIQKGHMSLHARNLALKAGAKAEEIDAVVSLLLQSPHLNSQTADACLEIVRKS